MKTFYGVSEYELNTIAQSCYHGVGVSISDNYLWYKCRSNRGHQIFKLQLKMDTAGHLVPLFSHNSAYVDEFLDKVNQLHFVFS